MPPPGFPPGPGRRRYDQRMADDEIPGWTRTERVTAILGLVLALGLLAICADVVTGGRVFRRGCTGCGDDVEQPAGV